jgi:hypothetical protein
MRQNRNTKSPSESNGSESDSNIMMNGMPREYGENAGQPRVYSAPDTPEVTKGTPKSRGPMEPPSTEKRAETES